MKSAALLTALLAAPALLGCSSHHAKSASAEPAGWRRVATPEDRERLRTWRLAWDVALARARVTDAKAIDADAALFDPDRALPGAAPPPGAYRCRTYKLGAAGTAMRDFTLYPWTECSVSDEGEVIGIDKRTGTQRPTGLLFPDSDDRMIFLGTLVLGDETSPLRYGTDAARDMVGYVERIGPKRWRWVFPAPRFESMLDVIEMVPAS